MELGRGGFEMADDAMKNDGGDGGKVNQHPAMNAASGSAISLEELRTMVEKRVQEENAKLVKGDSGGGDGSGTDSRFIQDCLNANELGDGEVFKRLYRGQFLFNKSMNAWMVWQGHHWDIDRMDAVSASVEGVVAKYLDEAAVLTEQIKEMSDKDPVRPFKIDLRDRLLKRASALRSTKRRGNCLTFAHTSTDPIAIRGDELDCKPFLFACTNGVLDLRSGEMRPGRPEDYLLKASPVEWKGIHEPCPAWDNFMLEIMEEDETMVAFLQRLFGYALIGACLEHKLIVMEGRGRNGKGTIVDVLTYIMGELAGPIRSEMLLDQSRNMSSAGPTPDIMALRGLRMAFASETDEGCRVSAARVKWLTGNDKLTGRNPHDKYEVSFRPTHTLFLLTNSKPHAPSEDFAFWARVILVPFGLSYVDYEPTKENERRADPDLPEKLKAEASGILAWMMRGCLLYQYKGGLQPPIKVRQAVDDYKMDEDNIAAFIDTCCYQDDKAMAGATPLYEAFEQWWKKYVSNFPMKQKKFGALMRKKNYHVEKVGGVYRYYGIGILDEEDHAGR
jgi:putative DNA primase/helicase